MGRNISKNCSTDIIGGQAVIEGIMMVNKQNVSIAVRTPDNKIVKKKLTIKKQPKILQLPFVRGIVNLISMLVLGMKALNYSANIFAKEDEKDMTWYEILFFFIISLVFGITLFKFLPLMISTFVTKNLGSNFLFSTFEGLVKISIFVLYIYLISFFNDVKRLFEYHGAEHKTIYCQEAGLPLTVSNIKKFSTLHPRCGTAFILLVMTISIIFYTFIPLETTFINKLGIRLLLLPVISGISYELLRLSAKHKDNLFFKIFTSPGLALQKLTTREPTDDQIEVAIAAVKDVKSN